MKSCVFFLSPSYMVGVSPTNLLCCGCSTPIGGGPHPPPGRPSLGGPPPGYPPPPPGTPPPGNPPLGNPRAGLSSSTVLIPCNIWCPVCGFILPTTSCLR